MKPLGLVRSGLVQPPLEHGTGHKPTPKGRGLPAFIPALLVLLALHHG